MGAVMWKKTAHVAQHFTCSKWEKSSMSLPQKQDSASLRVPSGRGTVSIPKQEQVSPLNNANLSAITRPDVRQPRFHSRSSFHCGIYYTLQSSNNTMLPTFYVRYITLTVALSLSSFVLATVMDVGKSMSLE
ncbi:hypothetical protein IG631_17517 [Alternaria alternata]|nr:hypothetical protein IG631_17517 [Alternaria alternata]